MTLLPTYNIAFPVLKTEFQLPALLCQKEIDITTLKKINDLLKKDINYKIIRQTISQHRTWTQIYRNCIKNSIQLPFPLMSWLQQKNNSVIQNNLKIVAEQNSIRQLFEKHRIQYIFLKGANLSTRLYQSIGARHFRDIDILVPYAIIEDARKLLDSEGYQCIDEFYKSLAPKSFIYKHRHHLAYKNKNGVLVELHWRLTRNRFDLPMDKIIIKKQIISDNDFLIYLANHGASHAWTRLKWLSDIDGLLRQKSGWHYETLLQRARQLKKEHTLASTLLLTVHVFATPLPISVYSVLVKNKIANKYAQSIVTYVFNQDEYLHLEPSLTRKARLTIFMVSIYRKLLLSQYWRVTIEDIAVHFRPGVSDFKQYTFSNKWFWLYYIMRPLRFLLNKKSHPM